MPSHEISRLLSAEGPAEPCIQTPRLIDSSVIVDFMCQDFGYTAETSYPLYRAFILFFYRACRVYWMQTGLGRRVESAWPVDECRILELQILLGSTHTIEFQIMDADPAGSPGGAGGSSVQDWWSGRRRWWW